MPNDSPAPLDHSLATGIAWTAIWRWTGQLFSWTITLYAARQLEPSDFGIVSMAMLGIGLARLVQDFGLDGILVQDRTIVGDDQAKLAGLVIMVGVALWLLAIALAEPIAIFFKEPQVALIIMVVGVVFVTDAIQVVPRAQMQRALQYGALAWTNFVQLAGTQVALVIALRAGMGYWSIVISTISGEILVTFALLRLSPYRMMWPRHLGKLTIPLTRGWRLLASRAASFGYSSADQTIIGRMLGKDALGIYSMASTFSNLPQQEIGATVSRVVPGFFSQVQDQPELLRRYFLRLTEFMTVLSFPLSVGIALVADQVMPLLLGDGWHGIIVPLRLLCAYAMFTTSQLMISHVLLWTGQFRVYMWCAILAGVTMPPALALGAHYFGLPGIGWAWLIAYPLADLPSFVFAFRTARIRVRDWLGALAPALTGCAAMGVVVIGVRWILPTGLHPMVAAGLTIGSGALTYAATLWFGFRSHVDSGITMVRLLRSGKNPSAVAVEASESALS
jgi:PST family polysaccharide transporter